MEEFVNNVRTLSTQQQFSQLCEYMNKSWPLLTKNVSHLDTALEALDIQEHSLGVLYILCAKVSLLPTAFTSAEDFEQIFFQTQMFIGQCVPDQVQYATGNLCQMFHTMVQELCKRNMAIRGIKPICMALEKIRAHPSQLTSLHAALCQLCLDSKCMKPALQYLDIEITDIAKENGWYECKHFLCYYYYGGMIYAAMKNYSRALYFFEQAITCPATVVSHIMLGAYKKYILVSLLTEGKFVTPPKYTSQVISRFVKMFCNEYNSLVQAYATSEPEKVNAVIEANQSVFVADKNLGLVKQVLTSLHKRNIRRLTKTFITLSLSDVASRAYLTGPEQAETYLRQMIQDQEICAYIDHESEMVSFYDDSVKYNAANVLKEIDRDIQDFTELDRKLTAMDENIQVNPVYVQKIKSAGSQEEEFDGSILLSSSASTSRPSSILSKLMYK
uniref:COP9 signalosome complex subunit 3 n=1 Tax=Phallusia mammillata TaxID=59560 RepID=A0A6F9DAF4_9ASCI|nr:COP9 signalosome complex subunit 3 [Phallusia mammillata]